MVELSHQALRLLPGEDLDSRCLVSINLGIAYWHMGKMDAADHALIEVLETGKATGNLYAVSMAIVFQGMIMAVRGKLHDASDRFQTIIQQDDTPAFLKGLAYLYLSVLHYEWNHLEQSGKYLLEAMKIGERIRNDELYVVNWMMIARIHMAGGNLVAAGEALDKAYHKAVAGEVSATNMPRLAAARVQLAIADDDLDAASTWARRMADGSDYHTFYRFTNTTQALYFLAQNKTSDASCYLEQCFERASQEGWVYAMIVLRLLQSLAEPQPEGTLGCLKDALTWAQPEGHLRTFVDLGDRLEPILQMAVRRRVMPDYAEYILSAMKETTQKPALGQLLLIEPLPASLSAASDGGVCQPADRR
jgi:LuxR family maltose regulon positive regulatory protein